MWQIVATCPLDQVNWLICSLSQEEEKSTQQDYCDLQYGMYPLHSQLHLNLPTQKKKNSTAPLKYLCYYHVELTQLLCWSTYVGTLR